MFQYIKEQSYLLINALPFFIRIPLTFLFTRCPARLYTGASALTSSATTPFMPVADVTLVTIIFAYFVVLPLIAVEVA